MSQQGKFREGAFRRGIFILPNLFTTLNMFFGFFSIVNTLNGFFIGVIYTLSGPFNYVRMPKAASPVGSDIQE